MLIVTLLVITEWACYKVHFKKYQVVESMNSLDILKYCVTATDVVYLFSI